MNEDDLLKELNNEVAQSSETSNQKYQAQNDQNDTDLGKYGMDDGDVMEAPGFINRGGSGGGKNYPKVPNSHVKKLTPTNIVKIEQHVVGMAKNEVEDITKILHFYDEPDTESPTLKTHDKKFIPQFAVVAQVTRLYEGFDEPRSTKVIFPTSTSVYDPSGIMPKCLFNPLKNKKDPSKKILSVRFGGHISASDNILSIFYSLFSQKLPSDDVPPNSRIKYVIENAIINKEGSLPNCMKLIYGGLIPNSKDQYQQDGLARTAPRLLINALDVKEALKSGDYSYKVLLNKEPYVADDGFLRNPTFPATGLIKDIIVQSSTFDRATSQYSRFHTISDSLFSIIKKGNDTNLEKNFDSEYGNNADLISELKGKMGSAQKVDLTSLYTTNQEAWDLFGDVFDEIDEFMFTKGQNIKIKEKSFVDGEVVIENKKLSEIIPSFRKTAIDLGVEV
jgi:hypothetical protein